MLRLPTTTDQVAEVRLMGTYVLGISQKLCLWQIEQGIFCQIFMNMN